MIREGLSGEGTSEQGPQRSKGTSHAYSQGKSFPGRGEMVPKCRGENSLAYSRRSKETNGAGVSKGENGTDEIRGEGRGQTAEGFGFFLSVRGSR